MLMTTIIFYLLYLNFLNKMNKTRRGTVIVETENGILLTKMKGNLFILPGGQTEKNETRIITAIRELKEETNLDAQLVIFLFTHESIHYSHKVFYIQAEGKLKPKNEIKELNFTNLIDPQNITKSSCDIMQRFMREKNDYFDRFKKLFESHNKSTTF